MVTDKTFSKGSEFPTLANGRLRLYSMRFCPFAERTRLVLAHKKIPHETVNVDLKQKPEWFLERNPKGLVPTLEKDDRIVYESLITSEYLDDVYPENRLTPADPFRKALDAMLVDFFANKVVPYYYKIHRGVEKEEAIDLAKKGLQRLEDELSQRGKFFGGDQVAMIDLMMWPWFERLPMIQEVSEGVVPSDACFPKLYAYMQAMLAVPAVKETAFDKDTHQKFIISSKEGKPLYDLGLE